MGYLRTTRHLSRSSAHRPGGRRADGDRTDTDEHVLVDAAQTGDRQAFAELYRRYAGLIHSFAASRVPLDDAADVVQEVFLRALRQLHALRHAAAFRAWITAIARNAARDVEQQSHVLIELEREPMRHGTQHDQMDAGAAARAIHDLPPAYRSTLRMRLIE